CNYGNCSITCVCMCHTYGDSMSQTEGSRIISQGDPVLLNCSYETSFTAFPFWYMQYPNAPPQLFLRDTGSLDWDIGITKGFNATHDEKKKTFHLWKLSSELSDSGTYYCIARDHSDTRQWGSCTKTEQELNSGGLRAGSHTRTKGLISYPPK
uniref:Immunoglobulin V-set domain-containing protein n=1 Tax=Chelydra serpentina TaxID=8475 RepID=A0A8C3SF45_CHESE